ncbi:hypothetical protein [Roseomonas haemaphysalidis]|uniref:Uncharacterized protein n=1 Tax=Roseomonas haemaphysalidis TaxID=2768162 RepID=A0ABS3KT06_9PROT|nr:hypothetical protein [Roseomonas haemaphysalidis]MBO1080602.1 hypothetical protein [Roseomonas haemaphysalidis]
MDTLRDIADYAIRRGMGYAALGIGLVMLVLAANPLLALQSGALMTAALWLAMWGMALRLPRIDLRHTRLWNAFAPAVAGEAGRRLRERETRRQLSVVLAERLMWHADRAGMVALGLGGLTLAMLGYRALPG